MYNGYGRKFCSFVSEHVERGDDVSARCARAAPPYTLTPLLRTSGLPFLRPFLCQGRQCKQDKPLQKRLGHLRAGQDCLAFENFRG